MSSTRSRPLGESQTLQEQEYELKQKSKKIAKENAGKKVDKYLLKR